jgi:hypothetical protein
MFPTGSRARRAGALAPALAASVLTLALGVLVLPSAQGLAAPASPPRATAEPVISGRAEQGRTLSASRGSWTGTGSISFAFRWVRCPQDGGRADGSNCVFVQGATSSSYRLAAADVGFRMRVRVTGTNGEGSQTVASNPTGIVVGVPVNTSIPLVTCTPLVDSVLAVQPGSWSGRQPISFSYGWLRCNTAGGECAAIAGATGRSYRLTSSDVNHKLRCNVTARNAAGSTTVLSSESGVVGVPLPPGAIRLPSGAISIPATSVPADQRLIVSQVGFSPNPVSSRQRPITVRVRVKDTRGYVVRDVIVFVRSTPRVTTGTRLLTAVDGLMTTRLLPLDTFPLKRNGRVQFFVKAYRSGDPTLGGVAGYRLVQVKTAPNV